VVERHALRGQSGELARDVGHLEGGEWNALRKHRFLKLEHAIRVRIIRRDGLSDIPQFRDTISIEPEDMNNRRARNAGAMTDMRVDHYIVAVD
jgi:hypothetical protein